MRTVFLSVDMRLQRGSVILEALIAVGIAAAYLSGLVGLAVVANTTSDRAEETQRAIWHMNEGLEALQTIAFADLPTTDVGSLTYASGRWTVGTAGVQALPDGMTRVVRVKTVSRDAQCLVVTSGGTVDDDSKMLESEVTWVDTADRSHTLTTSALRTRWDDPQGSCFTANMAASIEFTMSGAVFSGGKQLRQVYFTNTGGSIATIDTIAMTWNNGAELDQMFMDTSKIWSSSGPGTPAGAVLSGTELDIQDFTLSPGTTAELNKGQFNVQMNGTTLTMTVTFTDGSSWTSDPFNPL